MRAVVASLSLTDFRSWAKADLACARGAVVLYGPNGAGKTNVLEAISFLSPGKGLRGASAAEVGRRAPGELGGRAWAVSARLEVGGESVRVGTGLESSAVRRTVRLEGETVAPGRLLDVIRPVWLTPAHDRLFLEGASERRRFLDRLTFAARPSHATAASLYERTLRERLKLLTDGPADPAWLTALETRLAEAGAAMTRARLETVANLQAEIDGRVARPFPQADLSLSVAEAEPETLRAGFVRGRERDGAAGRTLSAGPHRSDLQVVHRERGRPAGECSTGEQKALILNIVLAQAARLSRDENRDATAPNPIVSLDEVAAHLDAARRAALFDEILALGLQVFLTGADRALFDGLEGRAQFVAIAGGELRPETQ